MAALLSHFTVSALPRAFARIASHVHCPLFSLSSVCHHHHLHYPHHTMNFSSTGAGYPIGITNFCRANYLEEEITGAAETIRSPDLVAMEYAELNLPHICEEVGHVRIRQHANPLSSAFSVPAEPPNWNVVFKDPLLPLVVDIGCGSGRFLLWLAKRNSDSKNYLGLEIRKKCPDPHFKKRHHKRRVLQKPLVDSIVNNLTADGQVLVQSDVLEVAADMRNQFDNIPDMLHVDAINPNFGCAPDGWLLNNPMGIRTEREIHAEHEGSKIYRRMYQKRT